MLKVCSHPRSGTHYLMAMLWANFDFGEDLELEAHADGRLWCDGKRTKLKVPWGKLFGTHNQHSEHDIPDDDILYIVRNPLEVVRSNWEFHGTPGTINEYATNERIKYWHDHVCRYSGPIMCVSYERLMAMPVAVLEDIRACFSLQRKTRKYHLITEVVGWLPKARMDIREGYNTATLDRFRNIIGAEFMGYRI